MRVAKRVPHRPGFPMGFWKEKQTGASSEATGAGGARVSPRGRRATGRVAEPREALSRGSHTEIPGFLLSCTDEAAGKRPR